MSFAKLKKSRKNSHTKLLEQSKKFDNKGSYDDDEEGFWKPTRDKAGNGFAVIRFLPEASGDDWPYVRYYDHSFQGPGGWYIEKSRTSLGRDESDPVSEYNSVLWNRGDEAGKELARKQKRRLNFVSNVLIVQDPKNPENEAKSSNIAMV